MSTTPACSYDCNRNGIAGDTWISHPGTAADCNHNGIPDACEIAANPDPDRN